MKANREVSWVSFLLSSLLVPVTFYVLFRTLGSKPAIGFAVATSIGQGVITRLRKQRLSPFFLLASGSTILFGSIDLLITTPKFYRLEPGVQNLLLSLLFGVALVAHVPIAEKFAAALPGLVRPELSPQTQGYLRKVAWAWVVYFFLKGWLYVYLAFQVDLGNLVILRTVIGGPSLALMFGGEILIRKFWKPQREFKPPSK